MRSHSVTIKGAMALAVAALLGGCMSVSSDGGMEAISAAVQTQTGLHATKIGDNAQADAARHAIDRLLAKPLTAQSAVQVALLGNRALQATYNDLGISEAQYVQASLPPSPTISLARIAGGMEVEIERQILFNLLALITLPARREIASSRYDQARLKAVEETFRLVAQTRRSFYRAVASRQNERAMGAAANNARIVSQLLRKLGETGAVNKLDQAREHVFYAEVTAMLARARMSHQADREQLARLMGLWDKAGAFKLPDALPNLPAKPAVRPDIEREAISRNVQVAMAQAELETTARTLGLTETTRYIDVLELRGMSSTSRKTSVDPVTGAVERERESRRGLELELRIPVFDFGAARTREAEETWKRALNRLADTAINVRSHAREAYARYRGAYDLARHYQRNILPLRKTITDENLLRYNAMIVDIVPVLADARQRVLSQAAAIEAQRDFWIAHSDMRAAVIGGGVGETSSASPVAAASSGGGDAGGH